MKVEAKRIILHSESGYSKKHDNVLKQLVDEKVLLFCTVGRDCELWHDVMDELYVGFGEERDFHMITTWHTNETLDEVIQFAEYFDIEGYNSKKIQIIEI